MLPELSDFFVERGELAGHHAFLSREAEARIAFEEFLASLSTTFIDIESHEFDTEIRQGLRILGEYLEVDRVTLWQLSENGTDLVSTHAWAGTGITPIANATLMSRHGSTWSQVRAGETFSVSELFEISAQVGGEIEALRKAGVHSHLCTPLMAGATLIGAVSMDAIRSRQTWTAELIQRIRLSMVTFTHALLRRQSELQKQRQQAELAHVLRIAPLAELAAAIAHELNQPLTAILANARSARGSLDAAEHSIAEGRDDLEETIQDIVDDAVRAGEVIRRLRELLRGGELKRELLDSSAVIRGIEPFAHADAIQSGAVIELKLERGLPMIHGDRIQLQQVLLNLVRNGMEASRRLENSKDRRITITSMLTEHGKIEIRVRDQGPGADKMDMVAMFRPFYTTKPEGLGMGLAICKSIVEAHGGEIRATRNPERGMTFHVLLPPADGGGRS